MTASEFFTELLEKPDQYVGYRSIARINAFLNGYRNATKMECDPKYLGYTKWLQHRLRISQDRNWVPIISFFGIGEQETLNLAREMWATYLREEWNEEITTASELSSTLIESGMPSEWMNQIFAKPAVFIGYASAPLMQSFMDGFCYEKPADRLQSRYPVYYGFHRWLVSHFDFELSPRDWGSVVSFIERSEAGAFKLARKTWTSYLHEIKEQNS